MKKMKTYPHQVRSRLARVLSMLAVALAGGTVEAAVITVNFNASPTGPDPSSADLDSGSVGGAWTVNQRGRDDNQDPGNGQTAIKTYSDAPGNNYLELDKSPNSDPFNYQLDFDTVVPLDGSSVVSFDTVMHRVGPAATNAEKFGLIVGYDASGDSLFQITLDGATDSSTYLGVGLVGQTTSSETIKQIAYFNNAILADMTTISIKPGATTFDLLVDGNTAYSGIAYDNLVTDLSRLVFTALDPNAQFAGYSIDNIFVSDAPVVPEPASVAMWSLLALLGLGYWTWHRR